MSKIICDVCGTSYPETATQCPICGCVRSSDSVTVAGDTSEATVQTPSTYTYVKGGRFSKSNVKKRNLGKPIYSAEPAQKAQHSAPQKQSDSKTKKQEIGLIVAVVVLLVAIAAVVIYIACDFLGISLPKTTESNETTTNPSESTQQTDETTLSTNPDVPCDEITILSDLVISFNAVDERYLISWSTIPANTTDKVTFASDDKTVATVDADGMVTAVGKGETTIAVMCGDISVECFVKCDFEDLVDPTSEPDSTDNTESSVPDNSYTKDDLTFADNGFGYEYTLRLSEVSYNPYRGNIPAELVSFRSNDESVATVSADGVVTFVGKGRVVITAKYNDWEIECIFQII